MMYSLHHKADRAILHHHCFSAALLLQPLYTIGAIANLTIGHFVRSLITVEVFSRELVQYNIYTFES